MPVLYKDYNISKDPEQHGIGGSSSGAIAAFMVAWERPERFSQGAEQRRQLREYSRRRRLSANASWQTEKKPIRVFLCDGRNDNRGTAGDGEYDQKRDWFYQNVRLMKALTEKGYDVNYAWGMNLHGQKFGGAILPEMMRWLWRDPDRRPIRTTWWSAGSAGRRRSRRAPGHVLMIVAAKSSRSTGMVAEPLVAAAPRWLQSSIYGAKRRRSGSWMDVISCRRHSLVLAGLEEDMTRIVGGGPAFLVRVVGRFGIGILREPLLGVTKGRCEIGCQTSGDRHDLGIAVYDKIIVGGIELGFVSHKDSIPNGYHFAASQSQLGPKLQDEWARYGSRCVQKPALI